MSTFTEELRLYARTSRERTSVSVQESRLNVERSAGCAMPTVWQCVARTCRIARP